MTMAIYTAVRHRICSDTTIKSLVGNRVYQSGNVPTSAELPYIAYQRISANHERHLTGGLGLVHSRFQIDVWGDSNTEVSNVGDALRERLDNYRGIMGSGTTVDVRCCTLDTDEDGYEKPVDNDNKGIFRVSQDYIITYVESIT